MATQFTINEVADRLGVCRRTIIRRAERGELRRVNLAEAGKKKPVWRIPESSVEEFLAGKAGG